MTFPVTRLRRLRASQGIRSLVQENRLCAGDLVMPLFVKEGIRGKRPIPSMPGQYQHSMESLTEIAARCRDLGIGAVLLFGIPAKKDPTGASAWNPKGVLQQAVVKIKKRCPRLVVIADVCMCEYTSHGHCGIIKGTRVDNDETLPVLSRIALSYAECGVDIVAPSDMMDGRVGMIRGALDRNGYLETPILSYAVKYASAFYGPFRDAAENAPARGDRRSYQMDSANRSEAMREVEEDLAEGADMILVKPALAYLDIVRDVKERFRCPIGCYSVSGEYSAIKAAAARGWLDESRAVTEMLLSMKRAGASFIVTYWAMDVGKSLAR